MNFVKNVLLSLLVFRVAIQMVASCIAGNILVFILFDLGDYPVFRMLTNSVASGTYFLIGQYAQLVFPQAGWMLGLPGSIARARHNG